MRAYFREPIATVAAGAAFLDRLIADGLAFHIEDDPADILTPSGERRLFRDDEVAELRKRQDDLYSLDWRSAGHTCPAGYLLEKTAAH